MAISGMSRCERLECFWASLKLSASALAYLIFSCFLPATNAGVPTEQGRGRAESLLSVREESGSSRASSTLATYCKWNKAAKLASPRRRRVAKFLSRRFSNLLAENGHTLQQQWTRRISLCLHTDVAGRAAWHSDSGVELGREN